MPVKALEAMPKVKYWHRCRKVSPNVWLPPQESTPPQPSSHSELFQRRTVSTLTDVSRNQRNSWNSGKQLMAVFRSIYSGKPRHNAWTPTSKTENGNMSVKHFVGGVLAHVSKHTARNMETCRGRKAFFWCMFCGKRCSHHILTSPIMHRWRDGTCLLYTRAA